MVIPSGHLPCNWGMPIGSWCGGTFTDATIPWSAHGWQRVGMLILIIATAGHFCLWIHILMACLSWSSTALFIMLSMCETLCPGLLSDSLPYPSSFSGSGCEHDDRQPRRYSQLRHYCDCSQTTPSVRHHVRDTVSLFWVPHGTYRCQPTSHHYAQESEACDCVSCCWCDT